MRVTQVGDEMEGARAVSRKNSRSRKRETWVTGAETERFNGRHEFRPIRDHLVTITEHSGGLDILVPVGDYEDSGFASTAPAEGSFVCADCFGDKHIKAFIEDAANSTECDFCGRESDARNIAAPLDEVVELILEAVDREYQRAVEVLSYESAEGGYQGAYWDSRDMVERIGLDLPNDDGTLFEILVDCLGDQPWCDRNPYSLSEDEFLTFSWQRFSEFIRYTRRYFFFHSSDEFEGEEYLAPAALLKFIGETVQSLGLVKVLQEGALIYRARQFEAGKTLRTSYDFAPPPQERAIRSNRMSPAGIVMFYASDDPETAVAEIDDSPNLGIAVGTFRIMREAKILDLTTLPKPFGFFERQSDSDERNRYHLDFLHRFVKSMAAKIEQGDREHIDYVPTQVVTEWFRTVFEEDGAGVEGIFYPSTQKPGGCSVVLFANRYDVVLSASEVKEEAPGGDMEEWSLKNRHEKAWLKLVESKVIRDPK